MVEFLSRHAGLAEFGSPSNAIVPWGKIAAPTKTIFDAKVKPLSTPNTSSMLLELLLYTSSFPAHSQFPEYPARLKSLIIILISSCPGPHDILIQSNFDNDIANINFLLLLLLFCF